MHGPHIIYGSYNALFPERNRCQEAMALCMRIKVEILQAKIGVIESSNGSDAIEGLL